MISPSLPQRRLRRTAVTVLALAMGATLSACGSSSPSAKPSSQPMQGGKTLAAVWPLTGLPAGNNTPKHPVLAVKIPNTPEASPQVGLGKADMVSEELVEGGITRLAVFFYSKVPGLVGPVRSMRASDIGIVKPLHATLVSSGAAPVTLNRLSAAGVPFFQDGPGYFRDPARIAPYNLMVHLNQLAATLKKKAVVPASYLPWGTESQFSTTTPARTVSVKFSSFRTSMWSYTGGHYVNTNSYAPSNDQFPADTVLVLRVREGNAGYLDPAGNPVPETIFQGKGQVLVFHDGKLLKGTWSKTHLGSQLVLTTAKGAPMKIPAGHVWIELAPIDKDGGHVSWTK